MDSADVLDLLLEYPWVEGYVTIKAASSLLCFSAFLEIIQVNVALRVVATTFMPHITALAGFVP